MRLRGGTAALLIVVLGACARLELHGQKEPFTGDDDDGAGSTPTPATPAPTPVPTSNVLYASDFETDPGALTVTGTKPSWEWGTGAAHGGTKLWDTNLAGEYEDEENSCLVLTLAIPAGGAVWQSWVRYDLEAGFDRLRFRSCAQGGAVCDDLATLTGENQPWALHSFDLAPYAGTTRELRWCLIADSSFEEEGISVDDVVVAVP